MPTLFGNGPAKIVTVLGFSDTVGGFAPGLRLAAFSASSPQSDLSYVTHAQHAYHLSFHLIQSSLSFPKKLSLVSLSLPHHSAAETVYEFEVDGLSSMYLLIFRFLFVSSWSFYPFLFVS